MNNLPNKGFILPNGKMITPDTTLSHEGMACNYLRKSGMYQEFRNSEYSSAQDFMVYKLNAMQIRSGGKPILILLIKNFSTFSSYIKEYKKNDFRWDIMLLGN